MSQFQIENAFQFSSELQSRLISQITSIFKTEVLEIAAARSPSEALRVLSSKLDKV